MLKAVLFDLDNTLILFDEVSFMSGYFPLLADKFSDILAPDKFAAKLMQATLIVHKNDGSMINRELFLNAFCDGSNMAREDIWQRFDRFYEEDFDHFKDMVAATDCAREVFLDIRKKGAQNRNCHQPPLASGRPA